MSKPMLGAELQIQDWVQGLAGIPAAGYCATLQTIHWKWAPHRLIA